MRLWVSGIRTERTKGVGARQTGPAIAVRSSCDLRLPSDRVRAYIGKQPRVGRDFPTGVPPRVLDLVPQVHVIPRGVTPGKQAHRGLLVDLTFVSQAVEPLKEVGNPEDGRDGLRAILRPDVSNVAWLLFAFSDVFGKHVEPRRQHGVAFVLSVQGIRVGDPTSLLVISLFFQVLDQPTDLPEQECQEHRGVRVHAFTLPVALPFRTYQVLRSPRTAIFRTGVPAAVGRVAEAAGLRVETAAVRAAAQVPAGVQAAGLLPAGVLPAVPEARVRLPLPYPIFIPIGGGFWPIRW